MYLSLLPMDHMPTPMHVQEMLFGYTSHHLLTVSMECTMNLEWDQGTISLMGTLQTHGQCSPSDPSAHRITASLYLS